MSTEATSNEERGNQEQLPNTRVDPEVLSETWSDVEEVFSKSEAIEITVPDAFTFCPNIGTF